MKFNRTVSYASPLIALAESSAIFNFQGSKAWFWASDSETQQTSYNLKLDDAVVASGQFSQSSGRQLLFATTDLKSGGHSSNITPSYVLGSVTWEDDMDADIKLAIDDDRLFSSDKSGSFSTVSGEWIKDQCLGEDRFQSTCHTTSDDQGALQYQFTGDGITIWGSVENYERGYSVSVDNIGITSYAGSPRAGPTNTTVLAHYANLGFGAHTVTIRNGALVATDMFASSRLEIDYVEVFTKHDALVDLNSQEGSSNERSRVGVIVGSIMGTIILCGLVASYFLYRRRMTRLQDYENEPQSTLEDDKASIRSDSTSSSSDSAPPKAMTGAPIVTSVPSTQTSPPLTSGSRPIHIKLPWGR